MIVSTFEGFKSIALSFDFRTARQNRQRTETAAGRWIADRGGQIVNAYPEAFTENRRRHEDGTRGGPSGLLVRKSALVSPNTFPVGVDCLACHDMGFASLHGGHRGGGLRLGSS
jgi:hypothetical protein